MLFAFLRGISLYAVLKRRRLPASTHPKTVVRMKHCQGSSLIGCPAHSPLMCGNAEMNAQIRLALSRSKRYAHSRSKSSRWRSHASLTHLQAATFPAVMSAMYPSAMEQKSTSVQHRERVFLFVVTLGHNDL